ncbi:hypothetical protein ACIBI4_00030 [Streptomyces sp. NPDC050418]|uniref:hypothetical protein n=1 Tax=Streptomyces sp. NPDC050418 TaxID=3365612 RepID=UPI0037AD6D51
MQERQADGAAARDAARMHLLVFSVASTLFLMAGGYFLGSMIGWWAGSDWMDVTAAVVFASVILVARLLTK